MTIDQQDRASFAVDMTQDLLLVLTDVTAVATSCQFCKEQYVQKAEDIRYLEEILGHMADAFNAVFVSLVNGEEKMLLMIMLQSAQMMESIKKQLGLS